MASTQELMGQSLSLSINNFSRLQSRTGRIGQNSRQYSGSADSRSNFHWRLAWEYGPTSPGDYGKRASNPFIVSKREDAFFELLKCNTSQFQDVHLHHAMLAQSAGNVASLVRHHPGTAMSTGSSQVLATTVDDLLLRAAPHFDILKLDTDGFDGEVLAGAIQLVKRDSPSIIFEWHPSLVRAVGKEPIAVFATLESLGYDQLLWFHNTGGFSHFGHVADRNISAWNDFLQKMQPNGDPHFDIIALPLALQSMAFTIASFGVVASPCHSTLP